MINRYQEILAAVRRAEPSTQGRIRCWVVARGPGEVWVLVLSYVAGEIEADVVWTGDPQGAEVELIADALNTKNGVGEPVISAMYKKYTKVPGAGFLMPGASGCSPLCH